MSRAGHRCRTCGEHYYALHACPPLQPPERATRLPTGDWSILCPQCDAPNTHHISHKGYTAKLCPHCAHYVRVMVPMPRTETSRTR